MGGSFFLSLAKPSGSDLVLGCSLYLVQPDQPDQTRVESFVFSTMSPGRHSNRPVFMKPVVPVDLILSSDP